MSEGIDFTDNKGRVVIITGETAADMLGFICCFLLIFWFLLTFLFNILGFIVVSLYYSDFYY